MFKEHYSSCALHSGPARFPNPCDCGGIKDDKRSGRVLNHSGYSRRVRARNFAQLWTARSIWLNENLAIPVLSRLSAMRSKSNHGRDHSPKCEVPPS